MNWVAARHFRPQRNRRVKAEGEVSTYPAGLHYAWTALVTLAAFEAARELFGIGGPAQLYEVWIHNLVIAAASVLLIARAVYEPAARVAWLAFGSAMAVWCAGSIAWTVVYGATAHVSYPTFADILWLLWYPLIAIGIVALVRLRIHTFELHRWMDGITVILLVLVAGIALVVEPSIGRSSLGWFSSVINFSYPVLDVLLIGAILGIYGLVGWKPDALWILVGMGIVTMSVADAVFAVQRARGATDSDHYDFAWTIGALLVAWAAWVRTPDAVPPSSRVTGLRAIALALVAQALAIGIQIYALFGEVGKSERVLTVAVLVIASVQIILTRPRAGDPELELEGDAQQPQSSEYL
ncbi:MAG: hypothetical protein ABSF84_07650 [Acidimicrobiales bacterium]